MFLFDWFRSFLPLHNPLGFGASDFVELALVFLLILLIVARTGLGAAAARFAEKTPLVMLLLFVLPIALRLALLPKFPTPLPSGADDYGYILLADTLRHFRLANPMHPMRQFFETVFALQEPKYASIYPAGQGLVLALGWMIFGNPWAGVLIATGAFCALCYWMLRAWTTPVWALIGGLLTVCEFGPLNEWMNIYWGGAVTAAAGCLIFGALPRLLKEARRRDAVLLGAGLGLHLLTRPYEFIFVSLSAAAFLFLFRGDDWRRLARTVPLALLALLPAIALTFLQAKAVTGSWTTIPYMESRYQYGVPTTFTWQANPVAHRGLTTQQRLTAEGQAAEHGDEPETIGRYLERWGTRIRFYRFFFVAPLYLALLFFLPALRERRFAWVSGTLLLLSLGTNFYPYFFPQYVAGAACLFVLMAVTGLERMSRSSAEAARLLLLLVGAHFLFWYGLHAVGEKSIFVAIRPYETWDYVNFGDPEGRAGIEHKLAELPGKKLVFVRYSSLHRFHEWIHNAADIDAAPVVMSQDLGMDNEKLRAYYPDRTAWLLEPDAMPVRLTPYKAEKPMFEDVK
jgi:hypothetical protein